MSSHRQQELTALPKQKPSGETVKEWNRQLEKLVDDARQRGDRLQVERYRLIYDTVNKTGVEG